MQNKRRAPIGFVGTKGRVVVGYSDRSKNDVYIVECQKCNKQVVGALATVNRGCKCSTERPDLFKKDEERILNRVSTLARSRGIPFNLDEDGIRMCFDACYYCGAPPTIIMNRGKRLPPIIRNGIDRIDSNLGYDVTNCVPCCGRCNSAKNDMSVDEFKDLVERIHSRIHIWAKSSV